MKKCYECLFFRPSKTMVFRNMGYGYCKKTGLTRNKNNDCTEIPVEQKKELEYHDEEHCSECGNLMVNVPGGFTKVCRNKYAHREGKNITKI